jgi:hypothetical protein
MSRPKLGLWRWLKQRPPLVWIRRARARKLERLAERLADRLAGRLADQVSERIRLAHQNELLRPILAQLRMQFQHSITRLDRLIMLEGRLASIEVGGRERVRHLGEVEFRATSQWGEDGIIEWLCRRIGKVPRSFIEFGVENFAEANGRFLIENRGWRGLVFDGNADYMNDLRKQALYWRHDLTAVAAFVTAENINDLIADHSFAGPVGILSIDIDGNDYWVLEAITSIDPSIIICEINGTFGDLKAITIPYRPDFRLLEAHYSGMYFGCSVVALQRLCARRGYTFVGTNTNGVNAFFVRDDLAPPVMTALGEVRIWPPRHRARAVDGGVDFFTRGLARFDLVAGMPVVDLDSNKLVALGELAPLYSDLFLEDFV